jgi:hypothetical protein
MKLSVDPKMIRNSTKAAKRILFHIYRKFTEGEANIFKLYNFQRTGRQKNLKFSFLLYWHAFLSGDWIPCKNLYDATSFRSINRITHFHLICMRQNCEVLKYHNNLPLPIWNAREVSDEERTCYVSSCREGSICEAIRASVSSCLYVCNVASTRI